MKVKLCYVKNILFVTFLYCIYMQLLATSRRADTNAWRIVNGQTFHSSELRKTRTSFVHVFQTLNGLVCLGGLGLSDIFLFNCCVFTKPGAKTQDFSLV